MEGMAQLLTVGHGTLGRAELTRLLSGARIDEIVDVRRFPGSRRNPDVSRDALESWLPETGIAYRWEERLGGRRHLRAADDTQDRWWRVAAFRAYAAHTRTPEFAAGLGDVLADVRSGRRIAVMCSETVWWRCHRRLIADAAVLLRDTAVHHLDHQGRVSQHEPAAGARVTDDGLRYDREA